MLLLRRQNLEVCGLVLGMVAFFDVLMALVIGLIPIAVTTCLLFTTFFVVVSLIISFKTWSMGMRILLMCSILIGVIGSKDLTAGLSCRLYGRDSIRDIIQKNDTPVVLCGILESCQWVEVDYPGNIWERCKVRDAIEPQQSIYLYVFKLPTTSALDDPFAVIQSLSGRPIGSLLWSRATRWRTSPEQGSVVEFYIYNIPIQVK
ncbi:MAG: hypothetical protein IAE83_07160 [Anaerolinea sp.]|nr:hypothetical protein [Anaerolinea sp.]CAG0975355.1 hypothetical protein ANRL4_01530 [Anaerolineae bacterium]